MTETALSTTNFAPNGAPNGAANGAANGAVVGTAGSAAPIAPFPPMKSGGNGVTGRAPMGGRSPPNGAPNGAVNGAANGAQDGAPRGADWVVAQLEEAGETLLCLPPGGYTTRLRTSAWQVLDTAAEAYGHNTPDRLRPPVPSAARISRMDAALGWLRLIPDDRFVLRRIVASRMLVSPTTGRHLFPWRRLGTLLGADHKAVQRWHGQGVALLVKALAGKG